MTKDNAVVVLTSTFIVPIGSPCGGTGGGSGVMVVMGAQKADISSTSFNITFS